jgi:hypothetical protein
MRFISDNSAAAYPLARGRRVHSTGRVGQRTSAQAGIAARKRGYFKKPS